MTAVGDTVVGRMTVVGSGSSGEDDGSRERKNQDNGFRSCLIFNFIPGEIFKSAIS
jgi:hypothetical protein